LALASIDEKEYGYIDKTGNVVIGFKYSDGSFFREGWAPVNFGGKWGYIDKKGNNVLDFRHESAKPFKEGLASIEKNDKWGFIDKTGREICEIKYDATGDFSEGFATVKVGEKNAFINRSGKQIIEPRYDFIGKFKNGFARVELDKSFGLIDKTGKEILEPIYDDVNDFNEGFALVCQKQYGSMRCRYVDTKGNFINKDYYSSASQNFDQGFAIVTYSGNPTKGVIDKSGKQIIPLIYKSVSFGSGVFTAGDDYGQVFKFDTMGNRVIKKKEPGEEFDLVFTNQDSINDQRLSLIDFAGGYANDNRILEKVNQYLDFNTNQYNPGVLMSAVDKLLSKAAKNKKSYQDFITYIFNRYLNPPLPCFQTISIHIALDHFCNPAAPFGGAFWVDKKELDLICDNAKKAKAIPCD